MIMGAPHERGLMLVKIDAMREFMTTIIADLQHMEQEIASERDAAPLTATEDDAS